MVKEKKSFLEKLTGARRMDEDMGLGSAPQSMQVQADEQEYYMEMNTQNTQNIQTAHSGQSGQSQQTPHELEAQPAVRRQHEENWEDSSDADGQLTIDMYQTESDVVIKSTIAGVKPEDLDVSINNDMITIKGDRHNEEEVDEENFYYQECYWGSFSRSVVLPVDVLPEKIEASLKNGILTIRLPKADTNKVKKIQVRGF